jgi:hypothetical protein
MFSVVRLRLTSFLLLAAPLVGLACGGDGGVDVVLPSLRITTLTTGVQLDPDGYTVSVDAGVAQPVPVDGSVVVDRLSEGAHSIHLTGLATNCTVAGDNPRSVSVAPGTTAAADFAITCAVVTGTVQVATVTTGSGTDPDGFALLLDGLDGGTIGASATTTQAGISPGLHTVGLTGLAANCQVLGENPREVTVPPGGMAQVEFAVTCIAPGPTTGTVEVVTTVGGGGTDPDGFSLLLDGIDRGPITVNATVSLAGVVPGPHSIALTGLAANCRISGENPRGVNVGAGVRVQVAFGVTCTAPGPTTGTLRITTVTTGPEPDTDGYLFSVDGGSGQPIGSSATAALANIAASQHSVELRGLASNCSVSGNNPVGVAIAAGETGRVSFAVTCAATSGSLRVTISGLPAGLPGAITVEGTGGFSRRLTESSTLSGLAPGAYSIRAAEVISGNTRFTPSVARPSVDVGAGSTATVTVSYTGQSNLTLNLRVDGLYLTQSTQTYASTVPLVAGRSAYLRVFVVANESNTARPSVRVQLTPGGAPAQTFTLPASSSVPQRVTEGTLGSSWNLEVPASLVQPGLTVMAVVDPANAIPESNENDNRFPASGTKALTVQSVAPARIRFISVQQGSSPAGDVSNPARLIDLARRLHPLNAIDVDVGQSVFPAPEPLQPGRDGLGWGQLVSDLDDKRVAEGSDRIYIGVVKLSYGRQAGLVGLTLGQGIPSAAAWDEPDDASRVVAHELGHVWGRKHSPCGGADNVDGLYPYPNGQIGVYGMDVAGANLKPPTSPDIMSYCFASPWISDYTYNNILKFRTSVSVVSGSAAQPALLVRGRLINGQPVLEPAFHIVTRPSLPTRAGPYTVSGTALDGSRLFSLSFDMAVTEDGLPGNGHFAFAVPLDEASAARLGNLGLSGPTGTVTSTPPSALVRAEMVTEPIVARREGMNVTLRWNAATYPMIMVRDPGSGEVLAFGRNGTVMVPTTKNELELVLSNGVRSQRLRLAIKRS